jgi:antitoxin component YwqK of YwqJK toxin-antitoxin module
MNKNLLIILVIAQIAYIAKAQDVKELDKEVEKKYKHKEVIITGKDSIIRCNILAKKVELKAQQNESYYWYDKDNLYVNMGSYSGNLLDGEYLVTRSDGSLITKGAFINGQKDGKWISWSVNGKIKNTCIWNKGTISGKRKDYGIDGGLIQVTHFRNNLVHGLLIRYTDKSTIKQYYQKGILKWEKTIFEIPKKLGIFRIM